MLQLPVPSNEKSFDIHAEAMYVFAHYIHLSCNKVIRFLLFV